MAETMGTPEMEREGVRKSIIQKRLNDYRRKVYGLTDVQREELQRNIETVSRVIERLVAEYDEMPDENKKEQIDRNVEKRNIMQRELDNPGPTVAENSAEYFRMKDVIPELEDILAKADPDLEFIPVEELTRRLEEQRRLKEELERAQRGETVVVNEEEIRRIEAEIEKYTIEITTITGFIENPESAREELLRRKAELEKRIGEIEDALRNGNGNALSDDDRKALDDRLKAAKEERRIAEENLREKNRDLSDLKRQLDEEIKKHNRPEVSREVVFNGIDDTHDAQAELNRIAQELNISPSELEIDWHDGANDYGDNVATEFDIVRVKRNDPILTVAERENAENELRAAEEELNRLNEESKSPNGMTFNEVVVSLDEESKRLADEIKNKEELAKLRQELRVSGERRREYKDNGFYDQEAREAANFSELVRQINELEAKVTERDSADKLQERIDDLNSKKTEFDGFKERRIAEIDVEIEKLTEEINANNAAPSDVNKDKEELARLRQELRVSGERRREYKDNGFYDQEAREAANFSELVRKINELEAKIKENDPNVKLEARVKELQENKKNLDKVTVGELLADLEEKINKEADPELRKILEKDRELLKDSIKALGLEDPNAERKEELANKIKDLKNKLAIDDERRAKNPKIVELDSKIKDLTAEIAGLEQKIADLSKEIKELEEKISIDDQNRTGLTKEEREELERLKRELKSSANRRADFKKNGFYDMEAQEASYYSSVVEKINELEQKGKANLVKGLSDEERAKLTQELKDKNDELVRVNEALENPEKTKAFFVVEKERYELLIVKLREEITRLTKVQVKEGVDNSEQIRIADNKIKELEELIQLKEKFKVKPPVEKGDKIDIPELPHTDFALDEEKVIDEYKRRKHDMYAKYYGDKDYQKEYNDRAERYRSHEVPVRTEDGKEYMTVEDYEERAEDEKFLILEYYREALERYTKSEAGIPVYEGTEEEIARQKERDREYVETRNYTFDQHKFTQKDLATMGKYGEKVPYIPKQEGVLKNIGRVLGNTFIFGRNLVAPVHRAIGKYIAQPIHRLVTGEKDASPYRNNFTHRITARRIYFEKMAQEADRAETERRRENAEPGEEVKEVRHPIKNWFTSRWKSIFNAKEGNRALLNAGEYDIQQNIMKQEAQAIYVRNRNEDNRIMEEQIRNLEEELERNPNAENAAEVREAIAQRRGLIAKNNEDITKIGGKKEITAQTDAIDYKTQGIARKELNTFRYTVIRGVARAAAVKFVGPAVRKWLIEHTMENKTIQVPTEVEQWVEGRVEETVVPKFEDRLAGGRNVSDAVADRAGTQYTGFYSVSGGEVGPRACTLGADDKITGWWIDNGTQWGTGVSDRVGLTASKFTDRFAEAGLLDANGLFRQDVSPNEILRICKMEGIDPSKIYVSVGDNHWAKAVDIFGMERVKVGEEIVKNYIPGHMEIVKGFKDEVIQVPNTRVEKILDGMGIVATGAAIAGTAQDVYENVRKTDSKKPDNKTDDKLNPPRTEAERQAKAKRHYERDAAAAALFGNEAHPESKAEYEAQFRRGVTAMLEDDEIEEEEER